MTEPTVMILAAGLGTRLRPLTDSMPKAMVPYRGVPMIERLMIKLSDSGFSRVVINLHHFADMLEEFVTGHNGFGVKEVLFSREKDLLDTGGAIKHAYESGLLRGPTLIHNVDILADTDVAAYYAGAVQLFAQGEMAADLLVSNRNASRYLLTDTAGLLRGWIHPAKEESKGTGTQSGVPLSAADFAHLRRVAFSGIHCIPLQTLELMKEWPARFSITDFYLRIADQHPVHCSCAPEGTLIEDLGKSLHP